MNKKTDYILDSMIKAYLSEQSPIGSMLLQDSLNVPASTIRVYFKQLDNDGFISKLHSSGGRIPTLKAMKYYWHHYFTKLLRKQIDINSNYALLKLVEENELFCMIIDKNEICLNDILNINDEFIILDFKAFNVLFNYSDELYSLFLQFNKYELSDIKTILYRLNLNHVLLKIENAQNQEIRFIHGEKIFANIVKLNSFSSLLGVRLLDYFTDNLIYDELFEPEFMGVKLECNYMKKQSNIILAGSIFTDYENVINQLKEAI